MWAIPMAAKQNKGSVPAARTMPGRDRGERARRIFLYLFWYLSIAIDRGGGPSRSITGRVILRAKKLCGCSCCHGLLSGPRAFPRCCLTCLLARVLRAKQHGLQTDFGTGLIYCRARSY